MLKIHESVGSPQPPPHLLAGNHFPGLIQKHRQNGKRLTGKSHADAVLSQLLRRKVYLKDAKSQNPGSRLL